MGWRKIFFRLRPSHQWRFCRVDDPAKTQSEVAAAGPTGKLNREPIMLLGKKFSPTKNIVN